jgi:hypothetical protein
MEPESGSGSSETLATQRTLRKPRQGCRGCRGCLQRYLPVLEAARRPLWANFGSATSTIWPLQNPPQDTVLQTRTFPPQVYYDWLASGRAGLDLIEAQLCRPRTSVETSPHQSARLSTTVTTPPRSPTTQQDAPYFALHSGSYCLWFGGHCSHKTLVTLCMARARYRNTYNSNSTSSLPHLSSRGETRRRRFRSQSTTG